jgi:hypothetical protein
MNTGRMALILVLLTFPGAAASAPFAQLGGVHPARSIPDKPNTDASLPLTAAEARRRVEAYLSGQGFTANDAGVSPTSVSYVRFGDRDGFEALADCHGPAVGAPQLWLETVTVDLHPESSGVRMTATGQFQVILKGLVSGSPFKLACRSRGALEAQVRDALTRE